MIGGLNTKVERHGLDDPNDYSEKFVDFCKFRRLVIGDILLSIRSPIRSVGF